MTSARMLLLLTCTIAACDKKTAAAPPKPEPATPIAKTADKPAADPACATKLKALEPWLAQLELETKSYEIDFGYKLVVINRTPMPVPQHVDAVQITKTAIDAYDVSEHDHARSTLGEHPTQKAVLERLAKMKGMAAGPDEFRPAPDDLIRIDVDQGAIWGDVVRVIDAATKAGYAHAVFAFTATSKLEAPAGVDPSTMTEAAAKDASTKLDALRATCKPWDSVGLRHHPAASPSDDAAALAKETAAALAECNCAADPEQIRALSWRDARWHQARARVGVTIALGPDAATALALTAKTPWSEAGPKLAAAAPDGAAVKLAAK